MIKAKELKLYIEDMEEFKKKIKSELKEIDMGRSKRFKEDTISFQSLDQLRKFLTPKRLELLRIIKHKKPRSMYELAKLVGRTPENVNTDIKFLKELGFVEVTNVREVRKKLVPEVSYDKMTLEIEV
ncbi:HTH domain-containing protein [Candidatus Woesearchaeota archaeon]|nr:HTH domain-containing protein [Candidatus Woesearchaeota archaeon]